MYWPPEKLLDGPLGRAVVAELCGLDERALGKAVGFPLDEVPLSARSNWRSHLPQFFLRHGAAVAGRPAEKRPSGDAVSAHQMKELADVVRAAVRSTTDRLETEAPIPEGATPLLSRVGAVVENYAFGSGWRSLDRILSLVKSELLPVAQALARNGETKWWDSPVELGVQRLTTGDERGAEGQITPPIFQDPLTGSHVHDTPQGWWSIPNGPSTTRGDLPGIPSVTLACREGHLSYEERWSVWSVEIAETARVYEVSCLEDWVSLAERYKVLSPSESRQDWSRWTGYSGQWAAPAWTEVMNSWDGVHISLLGYLSAAYRKVEVDGSAIYLAGWNPDETVWFSKARIGELIGIFASLLACGRP